MLNVNLMGGQNYIFFGTNFDLWMTSDPYREGETSLAIIYRNKRPTPYHWALARRLRSEIRSLTWPVSESKDDPCGRKAPIQTP
jgi:hypothetical protein